jgi:ribosome biogenesis protein ERB1
MNKTKKDTVKEAEKLLKKKSEASNLELDDDSSDEEVLVRTGDVPEEWYKNFDHLGYDIRGNRVVKDDQKDEIEKFMEKAQNKDWWRYIYDPRNNKNVYISDKDLKLMRRILDNKIANANVGKEEYFENSIPYQIHPVSSHLPSKKAFQPSAHERKRINRIIYAIKNGFMKLDDDEDIPKKPEIFDIWVNDNTDPNIYHPGKGFNAPKRELPDTEESYNPPGEDSIKYDCLRKIPKYSKLIEENMERCHDLVMSARIIRKRQNIKEEDILPQLPKPEELKPFPTKENILYKGHSSSIRCIYVEPNGKFMISADNGGFVYFWDIMTAKIIKRVDISDTVQAITYNNALNIVTICGKQNIYFLLPPFIQRKYKYDTLELINKKIKPLIENHDFDNNYEWKIPKADSPKERNGILFYLKWKDGVLENMTWHHKGDYFATLSKNSSGKTQVFIHSLSKLIHQSPFSKTGGVINSISFHTTKPYFFVATNSNIFVYNLQKQVKIF